MGYLRRFVLVLHYVLVDLSLLLGLQRLKNFRRQRLHGLVTVSLLLELLQLLVANYSSVCFSGELLLGLFSLLIFLLRISLP